MIQPVTEIPLRPYPDEPTRPPLDLGGLLGISPGNRKRTERPFPLKSVKVRAAIVGDCCRTVIEQHFANPYAQALEAVHIFPLPEDAAVTEMELRAGELIVRAECRSRQEAENAFAQAREAGKRAALLTQERADVHTLRVTNIPAKTEVCVRFVLIEHLESIDGSYCWRFPTVIAPRYTPGTPIGHDGNGIAADTDQVPDASRLQPPLRLQGGTVLDLEVELTGAPRTIESSLHAIRVAMGDQVRIAPKAGTTLNKDFVLWFAVGQPRDIGVRAYTDGRHTLVVVDPPLEHVAEAMPRDVVFLIDVSGSMGGVKLKAVQRAVTSALHSLVAGDRFRLIAFESAYHEFCRGFIPYDDNSLAKAEAWIADLETRGGTEMLPALVAAFSGAIPEGRLRNVILMTDGQATNDTEMLNLVMKHAAQARLFTVGIDTAVNSALLKRLARAGGGTCELLTPTQDIEAAIARIEARFGSPLITNLQVEGTVARPTPEVLFEGRSASFLIEGMVPQVRVSGCPRAGQELVLLARPKTTSVTLGPLWARRRIAWLEDEMAGNPAMADTAPAEIERIGLQYGIASRYTAFVAVEMVRSHDGELVTVVQPAELPEDWSEAFQVNYQLRSLPRDLVHYHVDLCLMDMPRELECCRMASPHRSIEPDKESPNDLQAESPSVDARLARSQQADGSFGGDVVRTAAALVVLILLGHTRKKGTRRRVVAKIAHWLVGQTQDPNAVLALQILERVEQGGSRPTRNEVNLLCGCAPEGHYLQELLIP